MIRSEPNSYSEHWFEFFHAGIPESRTNQEVEFVCACGPMPGFRNVLDLCCGMGRHARVLAGRGYSVTGVERNAAAVAKARELAAGPTYVQADVRDYQPDSDTYDLAVIMSQSFGHFDAVSNHDLLQRIANGIRDGGRIILDVWNPEFFATHQGDRELEVGDEIVRESKRVENGRLIVHLDYPGDGNDDFEWQLFAPSEMSSLAQLAGLTLIAACTDFDRTVEPSPTKPRIQFVLERRAAMNKGN